MAALIHTRLRHYSINQILQVLDGIVVILGATVFGVHYAFYAVIAVAALAKTSDGIIEGMHYAKAAYIITDKKERVAQEIMDMNRGVTLIDARGAYTGERRDMVFCVVSKKYAWGYENFLREADQGEGIRFPSKLRFYFTWILPLIVLFIFVMGYIQKFGA